MGRLDIVSDEICTTEIDRSDLTPEMRKVAENAAMREGNVVDMNRKIAFNELSILARTASPDSARVRAYELLCTKFPDLLDEIENKEPDSLHVNFTESSVSPVQESARPDRALPSHATCAPVASGKE